MRLQGRVGGRLDPQPVLLQPFSHQVAGQASMLSVDASTVCKPLIPREHQLYCTLPAQLLPFTPRYRGVLYVRLEEGDDGSHNLWGYYPNTQDDQSVDNSKVIRGHLFKQGYDDSEHRVDNSKVTKGSWSRADTQDIDVAVDNSEVTAQSAHRQCVQDSDHQVDNSDVSRIPALSEVSKRPAHREDVGEDERYLQLLASGRSSGASTPMSSGSEMDVPPTVDAAPSPVPSRVSSGCVVQLKEDSEYEVKAGSTTDRFLITNEHDTLPQASKDLNPATQPLNPWGRSLHTRLLDKMRKSTPSASGFPFLVLENVVARFVRPCILDLKVGSRLHGDDASQNKIASQSRKCNNTTSRSLGLRLCGMQVYQETTGTYKSLDKFHGRTLTDQTFCDILHDFLHNGRELRTDLLAPILFRLRALLDCLKELDSFRFYASSLLIIYDGLQPQCISDCGKDLKGWSTPSNKGKKNVKGVHVPRSSVEKDLKGLHVPISSEEKDVKSVHVPNSENEKKVMGVHVPSPKHGQCRSVNGDQCEQGTGVLSSHGEHNISDTTVGLSQSAGHRQIHSDSTIQPSAASPPSSSFISLEGGATTDLDPKRSKATNDNTNPLSPSSLSLVDVRMIDFAHTTHNGFHDNIEHEGPDKDYIWGLQNLTRMFSQLQKEGS